MGLPASVANKRLTVWLSALCATLTKKQGGGGFRSSPLSFESQPCLRRSPTGHGTRVTRHWSRALLFLTSLPPYFLTSRRASHASCYTVPPMARQRLGQHFLTDLHWREEIARAIRVSPHSTVPLPRDDQHCWIEIGSGHGEMTQH